MRQWLKWHAWGKLYSKCNNFSETEKSLIWILNVIIGEKKMFTQVRLHLQLHAVLMNQPGF